MNVEKLTEELKNARSLTTSSSKTIVASADGEDPGKINVSSKGSSPERNANPDGQVRQYKLELWDQLKIYSKNGFCVSIVERF
jgi:hypothetical protein